MESVPAINLEPNILHIKNKTEWQLEMESRKACKGKLFNNVPCPISIKKNEGNYCSRSHGYLCSRCKVYFIDFKSRTTCNGCREKTKNEMSKRIKERKSRNNELKEKSSSDRICMRCGCKYITFMNVRQESTVCQSCCYKQRDYIQKKRKRGE